MASKFDDVPEKLKPFFALGYTEYNLHGDEALGTCIFCNKEDKLFVNLKTQQWQCKGGDCGLTGNVYTFIQLWYKQVSKECIGKIFEVRLGKLAEDRGLPVKKIKEKGVVWCDEINKWVIPIKNSKGAIVNLRFWSPGAKPIALAGMELSLGGLDKFKSDNDAPIYLAEGDWDSWAMELILEEAKQPGIVLWCPGSDTFKPHWIKWFDGRKVISVYDHDAAGNKGTIKVHENVRNNVEDFKYLKWEPTLPTKFDIRDFYKAKGNFSILSCMFAPFDLLPEDSDGKEKKTTYPSITDGTRPKFDDVIAEIGSWLDLNRDMKWGIKICFAVVYSNWLQGDPLWVHIAAPPSSGKTAILMCLRDCTKCRVVSTITPASLVSGFNQGTKDPSLIPQLFGNTFVLKDFTEILGMNLTAKDEIYSTLRGAYDGEVFKPFGNGIIRKYVGKFSMLTGVTQEIFAETHSTSLGQRFLIYHMIKGVDFEIDDVIMSAMSNSGHEDEMNKAMRKATKEFLEYEVSTDDIPEAPMAFKKRISSLAQLVSKLRGNVNRDFKNEDKVIFRPQHEMAPRLAIQFQKLLICLALCNDDLLPTEEDYEIVVRVALDSCKGFNLEIIHFVAENPGCTSSEVATGININITSIRIQLNDMIHLGLIKQEDNTDKEGDGPKGSLWYLTEFSEKHWEIAGLIKAKEIMSKKPKMHVKWRKQQKENALAS